MISASVANRKETNSREDFAYDHERDVYVCPAGKTLTTRGTLVNDGATLLYRASKYDCDVCHLKPRCCPKEPVRKVPRSLFEGARDLARHIGQSDAGRASRRQRKKVEILFAHLKRILRLDRLRLRGPNGARDSSSWPPPSRTSGSSPSWSPSRRPRGRAENPRPNDATPRTRTNRARVSNRSGLPVFQQNRPNSDTAAKRHSPF